MGSTIAKAGDTNVTNIADGEELRIVNTHSPMLDHGGTAAMDQQDPGTHGVQYRVYKRRAFGLTQLVLLNIVVSWDWLTFAAVSKTSSKFFNVTESAINWLSTAFLLSFVVMSPAVIWALHRGPKLSIIVASVFLLLGNWIRYAGAAATGGHYGVVMFGQILIGFSQPFVLAAPTRYSDLWFSERGRVAATALASLANPFGAAIGQLVSPFFANSPSDIPDMVLYIAIISSVATIPSFFIPAKPPTPPSASSDIPRTNLSDTFSILSRNKSFWLLFVPFSVYVGFFNSFSSLINQILEPYGFSEDDAGIDGALLIVVGLVTAAVTSPIIDRTHAYVPGIRILVPILAICYLAFIWAPPTRSLAAPYALSSILGAASFSLVPIALEYGVECTFPVSPEVASTIFWTGGQLLGAIFIVVMTALKGAEGEPENSMHRALVFEAVVACLVAPVPMVLGMRRLGLHVDGRWHMDRDERRHRNEDEAHGHGE